MKVKVKLNFILILIFSASSVFSAKEIVGDRDIHLDTNEWLSSSRFGLGFQYGEETYGAHFVYDVMDWLYLKGEWSTNYDEDFLVDSNGVRFEGNEDFESIALLANFLPFRLWDVYYLGGFRVVGAAYLLNYNIQASSQPGIVSGLGVLPGGAFQGKVDIDGINPYIGIGWDFSFGTEDQLTASFDWGALFVRDYDVSITPSTLVAPMLPSGTINSLESAARDELDDDLEINEILQISVTYRL